MANVKKYKVSVAMAMTTDLETRDKLEKMAWEMGISRNDLVNQYIKEGLERSGKEW